MLDDEQRVVKLIQERIKQGRLEYGKLSISDDSRDWIKEALEEALDMAVYLAIQLMKIYSNETAIETCEKSLDSMYIEKEEKMSKKKKEKRENEWSFTLMPEDFNWNRIVDEALKAGYRYGVINVNKQPFDGYMNIIFLRTDIQDKINIYPGFCQTKRWYFIDGYATLRSEWDKGQKVVSFSTLKPEMYLKEIIGKIIEYDEQKEKLLTVKVECY